ncbi:MAG: alpha/beta hydrolase fold domain-containing protein [Chthoniobacterales bacterium]
MNKTPFLHFPEILLAGILFSISSPLFAELLAPGDSILSRHDVNIALHIPPDLAASHGPAGILILFGGTGDRIEYYQTAIAPLADALDLALVIPQMQWFATPGKDNAHVCQELEKVVTEIEAQFKTDPHMVIISGASAGGGIAHDLAQKWRNKTPLLVLHSTGPIADLSGPRTFHVVADKEKARLGPAGSSGVVLGRGHKDMFAVPNGEHEVHTKYMQVWLDSELAIWRLEQAQQTMDKAEEKLRKNDPTQALAILKSTLDSAKTMSEPVDGTDAFFQYETKHRQEIATRFAPVIKKLLALDAKITAASPSATPAASTQPPPATTP